MLMICSIVLLFGRDPACSSARIPSALDSVQKNPRYSLMGYVQLI